MIVVGIAGASGTGKSTVAGHIAQKFDGVHIDADRVAHGVLADDTTVAERIRREISGDVFDAAGRIDRRLLGRVVFSSPNHLARLNAIVHPPVMARCREAVEAARAAGRRVAVVDAVLLLEVAMPFAVDLMLALACDRGTRLARIMARGGWSRGEVEARLERQADIEKHFYKADAVVDTGRDLNAVLKDVDALVLSALDSENP